jgi:hypothetical protein
MTRREEIPVSNDMPTPPARRIDAQEKARQLLTPAASAPPTAGQGEPVAEDAFKKITTRIPAEDMQWLKDEAKRYRQRNPRAPRLTIEGLILVAIEHLKKEKDLDGLVAKYRY